MTDTATRPPATLLDELPDELQPAPAAAPVVEQTYAMVPIDAIKVNPDNPRSSLGDLDGLVASIRAIGVQQALAVEWSSPTSPYLLLAGHRRLAAAKLAGLTEVPCLVRQVASTAADRMKIALVENLMREGLAPLDEAAGYLELQKLGMSQREIAEQVGCSQSHVSKRMGLLDLPKSVQAQVGKGAITLDAAAALARLTAHPDRLKKIAELHPSAIPGAVEDAETDIAWEAKRAELVAVAEGKKWKIVDEPRDHWSARKFKTLAKWAHADKELDLDVRKHQGEPCHAVMIPVRRSYYNDKPTATSVCTDPARHGPKGASTLKVKAAAKPERKLTDFEIKQRDDKKSHAAAAAARRFVLAGAVAAYSGPKGRPSAEMTMVLRGFIDVGGYDNRREVACQVLGLEVEKADWTHWRDALLTYSARGEQELHRCAFAVAVAGVEANLHPHRYDTEGVVEYFDYLASLGYDPGPWEKAKLAEAAKAEENGDG